MSIVEKGFGRIAPTDQEHAEKYPLTATTLPIVPTPVVIGSNWYSAFGNVAAHRDADGWYWLEPIDGGSWGRVRGGHAWLVIDERTMKDSAAWWRFYDQGEEGACVGFASSRMMTLLNRRRYDGFALYRAAQRIDEWPGEDYGGTSVRAGMDVLRDTGPYFGSGRADVAHGISENRWARDVLDIAACLSPHDGGDAIVDRGWVTMLNSWGAVWPHFVRVSLDALDRLVFQEDGDATVVTDRS